MKTFLLSLTVAALCAGAPASSAQALRPVAWFDGEQTEFPESIAIDRHGNLYLSLTMAQGIKKITPQGTQSDFAHIPDDWLLGLTFDPAGNLVAAGALGIWKVSPAGCVWLFATVPGHHSLNDLVYDRRGNLYVTDDELGVIWKIDSGGGAAIWSDDPLFKATDPAYPFPVGCNGIAFSRDQKTLYVTNTSDGYLLAVDVKPNGAAGPVSVVAADARLIGADGIKTDDADNVYVAQNIQRKILRIKKTGQINTLAEGGLLSFPTSLVFGRGRDAATFFICNNGDAFFSDTPSGQGVLRLDLRR
ncbi:MAG: SMP-30/gluconolactonase/LRE family protein [Nibricoccus sp.]